MNFSLVFLLIINLFFSLGSPSKVSATGSPECSSVLRVVKQLFTGEASISDLTPPSDTKTPNQFLDSIKINNTTSSKMRAQILEGKEAEEVFVSVHMYPDLQSGAAELLSEPRFENVPKLYLVDGAEPITSRAYFNQATVVRHSMYGEVESVKLNTGTVNIMGGYCGACLAKAMQEVFFRIVDTRPLIAINVFADHSYLSSLSDERILGDQIRQVKGKSLDFIQSKIGRILKGYLPLQMEGYQYGDIKVQNDPEQNEVHYEIPVLRQGDKVGFFRFIVGRDS